MPGAYTPFSILSRIVGVETLVRVLPAQAGGAFSILSRIVGVETSPLRARWTAVSFFQYPQSDRWG